MRTDEFIALALREDLRDGDHTSLSCIPQNSLGKAKLLVKEPGILAGMDMAKEVFKQVDDTLEVEEFLKDGQSIAPGDIAFHVYGRNQSILQAERLALNIMQRMSGIATTTNKYVQECAGTKAKVLDTRKTTPNMRSIEKLAVAVGGGVNHRFGLYDMVMVKDNHIDFAGGIKNAIDSTVSYLKSKNLDLKIEVEARGLDEVKEILKIGNVHRIMLDNFNYEDTKKAVDLIGNECEIESSGGITLETVGGYAKCGVDYVSVGALTHSVKSLDLSLKAFE